MNLNYNDFAQYLEDYTGISVDQKDGSFYWKQSSKNGNLNSRLNYEKSNFTYSTWYPEVTVMQGAAGMLISCKMDFHRTTGDDHIILLTGFSLKTSGPEMIFAKASVQFHGNSGLNVISDKFTSGDFGQEIYDSLNATIKDDDFGSIDDSTTGRRTLPDIARANVNALRNAAY